MTNIKLELDISINNSGERQGKNYIMPPKLYPTGFSLLKNNLELHSKKLEISFSFLHQDITPKLTINTITFFQTLDPENRGFLTKEQLTTFMTQYGEPLDEEEVEEMMEVAYDAFVKKIHYEEFVNKLWYKPKEGQDVFALAERVEAEKPPPPVESKRRFSQLFTSQSSRMLASALKK